MKARLWAYIFAYWALLTVFQFYAPSANTFVHSFTLPPTVGALTSQRWSFNFWISGMYQLLWAVPITLAFVLAFSDDDDDEREKGPSWRHWLHLVVVSLLAVWLLIAFIYGCVDWAHANETAVENYFNPANDARWCCVNYVHEGAPCANSVPCPGVSTLSLRVNPLFLFQLFFGFAFFWILVAHLFVFVGIVLPQRQQTKAEPLLASAVDKRITLNYRYRQ